MCDSVRNLNCPKSGLGREFSVGSRTLCDANVDGAICVLDGTCPHEGGPLGEGTIEDGRVVCPWHAYAFDVHTGEAENEPGVKAEILEAKIESSELRVKL
jgi:nitrite reductase (NADH) small subunit